ncbi:MAG: threonylcarbamoyl-AMP synthase [Muribaculaceae bacterium]|nr:threonylcarbamoyl-AMP synthase [Muribaculaceae bacterium]
METLKVYNDKIADNQVERIVEILKEGGIIVIPTDTLYGIACDALNPKAIEKVCRLKGINPEKTNLSILCNDISMVSDYAKFDNYAFRLLKDNTPGPFTFLFRAASSLPRAFKGRKIVGIRIPDNEVVSAIVEKLGNPLLSTSITYRDEDYGMNPDLIEEEYENTVDLMVKGEEGKLIPSAILDCTGSEPVIVREGPEELVSR